jgi:1-acyl-sn-glycerol-3-phosphate acyltransferase
MRFSPDFMTALLKAFLIPSDPDDFEGRDPETLRALVPVIDKLARLYYRLEVEGLDKLPPGKGLVTINHNAGITFAEMVGFGARFVIERGVEDALHGLGHDAILSVPLLKNFLIKGGALRATHHHGDMILEAGRKILVAPGGNLEAFRPFSRRHEIDFGGHQGFIRLALRHQAPICPVVFIGGHETFAVLHDGRNLVKALGLHKLLRLDTFPIFLGLPWGLGVGPLFHLPLPSKCKCRVIDPIYLDDYEPEDEHNPKIVDDIYKRVTGAMQDTLTQMAKARKWPVIG